MNSKSNEIYDTVKFALNRNADNPQRCRTFNRILTVCKCYDLVWDTNLHIGENWAGLYFTFQHSDTIICSSIGIDFQYGNDVTAFVDYSIGKREIVLSYENIFKVLGAVDDFIESYKTKDKTQSLWAVTVMEFILNVTEMGLLPVGLHPFGNSTDYEQQLTENI